MQNAIEMADDGCDPQMATQGTTILLIEQNAKAALKLAHRGYVMETGRIVMENKADVLRTDDSIVKAYLGA